MKTLHLTPKAKENLNALKNNKSILKQVQKTLGLLQTNLRHPSLRTHKYSSIEGPNGADVFEAYVQNNAPGAYRIFWCYGPDKEDITILAITPNP